MSRRVDISAFQYAIIGNTEVVALSNDITIAYDMAHQGGWYVVETKELNAVKVNGYVGRDHARRGYIGYATVDENTDITSLYL